MENKVPLFKIIIAINESRQGFSSVHCPYDVFLGDTIAVIAVISSLTYKRG